MQTFEIGRHDITCRLCSMTSYHPVDIRQRYCGHCHLFHDQLGDWLRLTLDDQPEVSEAFTDMIAREVMQTLPADSQAGLKKILAAHVLRPGSAC